MIKSLTREQVRRVDQIAIDQYCMTGLVLMENAGRNASAVIMKHYSLPLRCVIICGPGNNGGDGCVIARHLHNAGCDVRIMVTGDESKMSSDMFSNYRIVKAMGLNPVIAPDQISQTAFVDSLQPDDLLIDALLGTGFQGQVRSPVAELIQCVNQRPRMAVVAIDIPSGLDCDSGSPTHATIIADLTITFVARKIGFDRPQAAKYTGQIEVADIGVPEQIIDEAAKIHPIQ